MAIFESNQMRRAHRVNIPLTVIINKKSYSTKDWSMTGIGLLDFDQNYPIDSIIDGFILVTLQDARVEMPVKLQLKVKKDDGIAGFEFYQISEKNKRVLREFLELSIEGKLDQVDNLIGIYNEPIIDTPIKESVVLSDEEQSVLKKAFDKRAKLYIRLAILFFIIILLTIYYNTTYIYRSIGTVSGNFIKISSNINGKISHIYIKPDEAVQKNTLLYDLDNSEILQKINLINKKITTLHELTKQAAPTNSTRTNNKITKTLLEDLQQKESAYRSARKLYEKRYITKTSLEKSYVQYTKSKLTYLQKKANLELDQTSSTKIDSNILLAITKLQLQKQTLLNQLNNLRVLSPINGYVYSLNIQEGNFVKAGQQTVVIETDKPSFVVSKIKADEALHVFKGMPVKIYVPSKETTLEGYVSTIGNLALNTESHITNEVSLKEITVKILFKDNTLHLPLNERVKIWFYRPLF